jgi:hypothetical protein
MPTLHDVDTMPESPSSLAVPRGDEFDDEHGAMFRRMARDTWYPANPLDS